MRVLLLTWLVLMFLEGCASSTAPKPASTAKKEIKSYRINGKSLGVGVYAFTANDFAKLSYRDSRARRSRIAYNSPGEYAHEFEDDFDIAYEYWTKSTDGSVKFGGGRSRQFDDAKLNYASEGFYLADFAYDAQKNRYIIIGTNHYGDFPNPIHNKKIGFALVFDAATKRLHKFYQGPTSYTTRLDNKQGNAVVFFQKKDVVLLNLAKEKAVRLQNIAYPVPAFSSFMKSSPKGNYVAIKQVGKKEGALRISLHSAISGKQIAHFDYTKDSPTGASIDFDFSEDERYFIFKGPNAPFQLYDIAQKKVTKTFGENKKWASSAHVIVVDGLVLGSFSGRSGKNLLEKAYIYDMQHHALFCKLDDLFDSFNLHWRGKNTLHAMESYGHHVRYSLQDGACLRVDTKWLDVEQSAAMKNRMSPMMGFIRDGHYLLFDSGKITEYMNFNEAEVDTKKVHIVKSLENAKRLMDAGFDEKAFAQLKKLLTSDTSYFEDYYDEVRGTLFVRPNIRYAQEAYFNALAFNTYVQQGKTRDNSEFERAAKNYAFFATLLEFQEVLPAFIAAYKTVISSNPSALQQDMLAIYKAMYLFETNKDAAAYDLLFAANPFEPEAKKNVISMSAFSAGLFKDRHKVAVALGMKVDEFNDPAGYEFLENESDVPYFYDLGGNKIKRGEAPKSVQVTPSVSNETVIESEYIPLD